MVRTVVSSDIHNNKHEVPVDQLTWRPSAYAIVIHDNKILLTKQHKSLHLPGGGIELGEMPEECVIREVREETGIRVNNPKLTACLSTFFTMPEGLGHVQSFLLYYQCELVGGELSISGFEEYEKTVGEMPEWIALKQLDSIVAGGTVDWRSVVKQALKNTAK